MWVCGNRACLRPLIFGLCLRCEFLLISLVCGLWFTAFFCGLRVSGNLACSCLVLLVLCWRLVCGRRLCHLQACSAVQIRRLDVSFTVIESCERSTGFTSCYQVGCRDMPSTWAENKCFVFTVCGTCQILWTNTLLSFCIQKAVYKGQRILWSSCTV